MGNSLNGEFKKRSIDRRLCSLRHSGTDGTDHNCDTLTIYRNQDKPSPTLWISCFPGSIISDLAARTLYQNILTPTSTTLMDPTSAPATSEWILVLARCSVYFNWSNLDTHFQSQPNGVSLNPVSVSTPIGASFMAPTPNLASNNNGLSKQTSIIIGILVPTFFLIICGSLYYLLSFQKRWKREREEEEARRYLENLANQAFPDDELEEMPNTPSKPEVSEESKASKIFSTASMTDSTAEEPTNLSSYSELVYGN